METEKRKAVDIGSHGVDVKCLHWIDMMFQHRLLEEHVNAQMNEWEQKHVLSDLSRHVLSYQVEHPGAITNSLREASHCAAWLGTWPGRGLTTDINPYQRICNSIVQISSYQFHIVHGSDCQSDLKKCRSTMFFPSELPQAAFDLRFGNITQITAVLQQSNPQNVMPKCVPTGPSWRSRSDEIINKS